MDLYSVQRLYPQYQRSQDRRQRDIPVAIDRRSGQDRREQDRVVMDKQLTKDIFEVKSKIAKIEALSPKLFTDNVIKQAPTFSAMNNMTQDVLLKESKPDPSEIARQEVKLKEKEATAFKAGMLAFGLAAAIGLSCMSTAGAIVAIGTGLYIGVRALKAVIVREMKDRDDKNV